jgi:DNA-binding MarR family transcriptional regulator
MTGHLKASHRDDDAAEAWELLVELTMRNRPRWMGIYAEYDLSPPQFFALRRLHMHGSSPMSELAQFLACDRSNVTGIIDRLEARGLVERGASPGDRRVRLLALTDAGRALHDEVGERMMNPPEALAALTSADQRALRDLLRRALDAVPAPAADAIPPAPIPAA